MVRCRPLCEDHYRKEKILPNYRKNADRGKAFQLTSLEKLEGRRPLDSSQGTEAGLGKLQGGERCYRFSDLHVCDLTRGREFSLTYPEERKTGL